MDLQVGGWGGVGGETSWADGPAGGGVGGWPHGPVDLQVCVWGGGLVADGPLEGVGGMVCVWGGVKCVWREHGSLTPPGLTLPPLPPLPFCPCPLSPPGSMWDHGHANCHRAAEGARWRRTHWGRCGNR